MKKVYLTILVIAAALLLCGCGLSGKTPRVEIVQNVWRNDTIYLPLRENHTFAEVPYSIEETSNGYDIIIHCMEK